MIYIHGLIFTFLCFVPALVSERQKEESSTFEMLMNVIFIAIGLGVICATAFYAGANWFLMYEEWVQNL